MADETCRGYEVDGEPVRVHGGAPLTDEGQAALTEVVRAARKLMAEEHPNAGVIQDLVAAARAAAWCIPDGMVPSKGRYLLQAAGRARLVPRPPATRRGLLVTDNTPQHLAGELIADLLNDRLGFTMWSRDLDRFGEEIAQHLCDAGLLALPEAGPAATEGGRETL